MCAQARISEKLLILPIHYDILNHRNRLDSQELIILQKDNESLGRSFKLLLFYYYKAAKRPLLSIGNNTLYYERTT